MKLNITSADLNVSNSTGEINGALISFNAQEDSEQSISGMIKLTKEEYGDGSLLVNRVKSKLISLIDSETISLSSENMELLNKIDQLTLVVGTILSSSTSVMSFEEMLLKAKEFKMKNNNIAEVITPNIKELKDKTGKNANDVVEFKTVIDKLVKVLLFDVSLKEESLLIISSIYDDLVFNKSYAKGSIVIYEGNVYEILEDIRSNRKYLPDNTPTQYARLNKIEEVLPVIEEEPVIIDPSVPVEDPTNTILP